MVSQQQLVNTSRLCTSKLTEPLHVDRPSHNSERRVPIFINRHHHHLPIVFHATPFFHRERYILYWEMPMTPQAGRAPALPVFLLSSFSPLPRSSVPACTTTVRPSTLSGPISLMNLSETEPSALPWASVLKLPRSPTWRSLSEGAPWVLLWGLTGGREVLVGGW